MKLAWVTVWIPLVACGRAGFNPVPDAPAPAQLACTAAPPSFALDANVQAIAAASTPDGYVVFTTDDTGAVTGRPFALSATDPTHTPVAGPTMSGLASGADGRQIGASAADDVVELEVPDGPANAPTGFTRVPLTAQLAPRGAPASIPGWTVQIRSIAFNSAGVGVYIQQTTGPTSPTVQATTVASPGGAFSSPVTLKQPSDQVFAPTIAAAGDKFVLTWISTQTSDVFMQLFATDPVAVLKPASAPVQITTSANNGGKLVHAAYAGGTYMITWGRKDPAGVDQVWFSLLDKDLAPIAGHQLTATTDIGSVVAGDDDFLVAWQDGTGLGAARIGFDGTSRTASIASSGGAPINNTSGSAWDLVDHNGQPALIWGEIKPDASKALWLDPLCFAQP